MILIPMMLSPAVVGNFWTFLYQPQIGLFNYALSFFTGSPRRLSDDRRRQAGAMGDHHRRHLDVDAVRDADLSGRAALHPGLPVRGGRGRSRFGLAAVLVNHAADGAAVHHAGDSVSRHRELQDVRHGQPADLRRARVDHRSRVDHAEARGVREVAYRLFVGVRDHPVRRRVRTRQYLRQSAQPGKARDERARPHLTGPLGRRTISRRSPLRGGHRRSLMR